MVIRLKEEARKRIDENKNYVVVLEFDEKLRRNFQVTFTPNVLSEQIKDILNKNAAIRSFQAQTAKVFPSDYAGTIEIHL